MRRHVGLYLAYVDMLMALVIVFWLAINDEVAAVTDNPVQANGEVRIELHWPDNPEGQRADDVDLWVKCPQDERPVGYSNRTSGHCDLERDDLGSVIDDTPYNFEVVHARGVEAGEYVVNAHYFRANGGPVPVPLRVVVYVTNAEHATRQALTVAGELRRQGDEITLVRFTLDERGTLVGHDDLEMPLRSAGR